MPIGGSLLPSTPSPSERIHVGKHGTLRVIPSTELDTHFLTLGQQLLVSHPNGYSCAKLAKRIVAAWGAPSPGATKRALDQVKYILDCGGMAKHAQTFDHILNQGL